MSGCAARGVVMDITMIVLLGGGVALYALSNWSTPSNEAEGDAEIGVDASATSNPSEPPSNPEGWPFGESYFARSQVVSPSTRGARDIGPFDEPQHQAALFDTLRRGRDDLASMGVAIRYVLSGYRNQVFNRQIGGVSGSLHTKGLAFDFRPTGSTERARLQRIGRAMAAKGWRVIIYDKEWAKKPESFIHLNLGQSAGLWWNINGKTVEDSEVEL